MNTKLLSIVILGLAFLNNACSVNSVGSDEVSSKSVYQSYSATYDENSNLTSTNAQFRVKNGLGDTVELLYPSYILVNNAPMNHENFLGSWYERDFSGYIKNVTFRYTDSESKKYENTFEVRSVGLKNYNSHIDLNNNYKIELKFADLRKDENLLVTICQQTEPSEEYPSGTRVCAYGDSRANFVLIKKSEFHDLKPGSAEMTVLRALNTWAGTFGSRGGHLVVRYIAKTVMVNLEDVP